ncbi:MAG: phosphoribosylamine--glycine ligase [Deltaproteobacteria bacterium]|nr:phosphoribosylamine--glycine ligase [Deltaproteobacteria bacterium]
MKVLVVGGGGREHSLVWKLNQSSRVTGVYCAPGNAGIAREATTVPIAVDDIPSLIEFAGKEGIGLTCVGPELPLTLGIVDAFESEGLRIFGASRGAAEIEGSKVFTKDLLAKYNIPSGTYEVFGEADSALDYLKKVDAPIVVKADGLAAGKGAIVCMTIEEAEEAVRIIMEERRFGDAGDRIVIEEFLTGEEASFLAFSDGKTVLPMATSQDHKPIFDGDKGPNTGGMGAYSPAPVVTPGLFDRIMEEIMIPTVQAMAAEGRPYKGVLYAGLMIQNGMAKVLEFNARFGDPEAQPLFMRMDGDLVDVMEAVIDERLDSVTLDWHDDASICVVMASGGYPGSYEKGKSISGLEKAEAMEDVKVFHAGTAEKDGRIVTSGGRVLGVTARGMDIRHAIERAYRACEVITWEGAQYRRDIGAKAMKYLDK